MKSMKNFKSIFFMAILFAWITLNVVLADDSDCWIFWAMLYEDDWSWYSFKVVNQVWETDKNKYSNFLDVSQQNAILTKDDLNTALLNLKKYCCENNLWWLRQEIYTCSWANEFFNENALDSRYLYDHIFDVMMRRLNWFTGDNYIYAKTNMTIDSAWVYSWGGWREFINSKAEDLSWSDSQSIINEYQKYRKQNPWYDIVGKIYWNLHLDSPSFLSYVSGSWSSSESNLQLNWDESESVAKVIKEYDKRTLYDKYHNACALSLYFYSLLDNQWKSKDDVKIKRWLAAWDCDKLVQSQIDRENLYVQLVIQRSSNLFLSNYIEWYLWYLYDRWEKLKTLRKDTTDRFLDVVRAVPNLVKQCNK